MSEAYLITGIMLPAGTPLDELLPAAYTSAGIKSGQINEIQLFTDNANALFHRRLDSASGPLIQWPLIPGMETNSLFSLTRALEIGELSLGILAEVSAHLSCAIILANPGAVGRLNLSPRTRLGRRITVPEGISDIPHLASNLIASIPPEEPSPEEEVPDLRLPPKQPLRPWLAIQASEKPEISDWPEDRLITGGSLFPVLLRLAKEVSGSRNDPGVLVQTGKDEPGSAFVVMPV